MQQRATGAVCSLLAQSWSAGRVGCKCGCLEDGYSSRYTRRCTARTDWADVDVFPSPQAACLVDLVRLGLVVVGQVTILASRPRVVYSRVGTSRYVGR